jgi:hypothetical protein
MSTSIDGSVNGKKRRAEAHLDVGTSKNALQNSSSTQRMLADVGRLVDDQALDLMEHRRVGLVGIHAVGRPGMMMRIGGFWPSMVRICTGEVCVRSSLALAVRVLGGRRTCRASRAPDGRRESSAR